MRGRTVFMAGAVAAVVAGLVVGGSAVGQAAVSTQAAVAGGAPYIYPATGGRDPVATMSKTEVNLGMPRTLNWVMPCWRVWALTHSAREPLCL